MVFFCFFSSPRDTNIFLLQSVDNSLLTSNFVELKKLLSLSNRIERTPPLIDCGRIKGAHQVKDPLHLEKEKQKNTF
jgi:hypothetical protein